MIEKIKINQIASLAEELRENTIGNPIWDYANNVYIYPNETIEVVVILKLMRALLGLKGQLILCHNGLLYDMSTLYRCVNDSIEEIRFLLEKYPEQSSHVKQFIKNFFEYKIDHYKAIETNQVLKKKIHSANVRYLTGQKMDENIRQALSRVHKTFSGYIHGNYSHIMQNYGGEYRKSFNLLGIPELEEKIKQSEIVFVSYNSLLLCILLISKKFKQNDIAIEIEKLLNEVEKS